MASTPSSRTYIEPYEHTISSQLQSEGTIDPTGIQKPSSIPPANAQFVGISSQGLVDVYCGTMTGDIDAQPAAKELLGTAPDTLGSSNADYVYTQLSKLFGGANLPRFLSLSGNNVVSIIFVSGSRQGGYGAFHIDGAQTDFDRIVVDSLTVTGDYSPGSGLGSSGAQARLPHLFAIYGGTDGLCQALHRDDPRLRTAKSSNITGAMALAAQTRRGLKSVLAGAKSPDTVSKGAIGLSKTGSDPQYELVCANQDIKALLSAVAQSGASRHYLSTALFTAELVESFQKLTGKANPQKTDGESVSRVISYKLVPEIALVPGFNGLIIQQWWKDGAPDLVNSNTENDQSTDGNGAGVMFLEFLTDYLGIAFDDILKQMPSTHGAPLGQTYVNLLTVHPELAQTAGPNGRSAFQKMVSLLKQNSENRDGTLNLPADGNPFIDMPGSKQGGVFHKDASKIVLSQTVEKAVSLARQFDQQFKQFKNTLQQIQSDATAPQASRASSLETFGYRAPYQPASR